MELHMTANILNTSLSSQVSSSEDEFSIPIDISDILYICQEYNKLGWQVQTQVAHILELGVEEAIKSGLVKQQSLPFITSFLTSISKNPYFGDAVSQADECLHLINKYSSQEKNVLVN